MKAQYGVAIDQHGNKFYFGKHCRKDLSEQIPGRVSKMYIDTKSGNTSHTGYVIGTHWLTVYAPIREKGE
jgi:hypothetical protein